jgi:hypothetical protein
VAGSDHPGTRSALAAVPAAPAPPRPPAGAAATAGAGERAAGAGRALLPRGHRAASPRSHWAAAAHAPAVPDRATPSAPWQGRWAAPMAFLARNRCGRGRRPARRSRACRVAAWRSGVGGWARASARRLVGWPRPAVASNRPPGCRPRAAGYRAWCRSRTRSGRGCPARSARRPRTAACRTAMPVVATKARRRAGRRRHLGHRRSRPASHRLGRARPGCARPPRACRGGRRGDRSIRWSGERRGPARTRVPSGRMAMPSGSRSRCPSRETAGSPACWCGTRRGRVAVGPRQTRWSRMGSEVPDGRWAGRLPGVQWNRCPRDRMDLARRPRCRTAPATAPTPTWDRRGAGRRTGPEPDQTACLHHPRAPAAGRVPWPSRSNAPSGRHAFARGGRTPLVQSGSNR